MLRPAEARDLDAMRTWRNQDANREVSITQHVIAPEEHRAWWDRVSADPTKRVYVFSYGDQDLGVVNFFDLDESAATGSWGFFLDHETTTANGTAMMAWMKVMREATDLAFTAAPEGLGLKVLSGEVRPENEAVRMMNRRFGFREGTSYVEETDAGPITLIPITMRAEDRKQRGSKKSNEAGVHS